MRAPASRKAGTSPSSAAPTSTRATRSVGGRSLRQPCGCALVRSLAVYLCATLCLLADPLCSEFRTFTPGWCEYNISTNPGCCSTILSNTSAGPDGVRSPASHACTSFVLTFKHRARTPCDACNLSRTARTSFAVIGAGGCGNAVDRRLRFPRACSRAWFAAVSNSAKSSGFIRTPSSCD